MTTLTISELSLNLKGRDMQIRAKKIPDTQYFTDGKSIYVVESGLRSEFKKLKDDNDTKLLLEYAKEANLI